MKEVSIPQQMNQLLIRKHNKDIHTKGIFLKKICFFTFLLELYHLNLQ